MSAIAVEPAIEVKVIDINVERMAALLRRLGDILSQCSSVFSGIVYLGLRENLPPDVQEILENTKSSCKKISEISKALLVITPEKLIAILNKIDDDESVSSSENERKLLSLFKTIIRQTELEKINYV